MIDRSALVAHHKSKKHKQRVKQLKDAPWSQKGLGLMILAWVTCAWLGRDGFGLGVRRDIPWFWDFV